MELAATVIAYVLFVLAGFFVGANWWTIVVAVRRGKDTSLALFVGGLAGFLACLLHPAVPWTWGFLPVALDPGCLVLPGVFTLARSLYRKLRGRREA